MQGKCEEQEDEKRARDLKDAENAAAEQAKV